MDRDDFFKRSPGMIGARNYGQYAVLAILVETVKGPALLFEKRSEMLNRQAGEICFPGGRLEAGEKPVEGAIRETIEELLVKQEQIEIIGPGDIYISPYNMIIYPFIAKLQDYNYRFSHQEVSDVFTVPVRFFQENEPKKYINQLFYEQPNDFPYESIPGGKNYPWSIGTYTINFYHYEEAVIWGMTAAIVESVVGLIKTYQLLSDF